MCSVSSICLSTLWFFMFLIAGSSSTDPYGHNWGVTRINAEKISYLWTISNYSLNYQMPPGGSLMSPIFSENGTSQWKLRWQPANEKHVSLFLYSENKISVTAHYKFFIIDGNGMKTNEHSYMYNFNAISSGYGWNDFMLRSDLENTANNLLPNDSLTILVEMLVSAGATNISGRCRFSNNVTNTANGQNAAALWASRFLTDVRITVDGVELIEAHRAILASHSSWFWQEFIKDLHLPNVAIKNTTTAVAWQALRFMYTGEVQDIEVIKSELLALSDQLGMARLKVLCEEVLCRSMRPINATDILMLARRHNAKNLEREASNYIAAHVTGVVDSPAFEKLENTNPNPFYRVLRVLINKRKD